MRWLHFRWVTTRSDPFQPGFWRGLERGFRHQRKRLFGHGPAPVAAIPALTTTRLMGQAKLAAQPPATGASRFALYVNSQGNYFVRELAELLQAGLRGAGYTCQLRTERDGASSSAQHHLVLAPHEFFFLADGWKCFDRTHQGRLFLLNTEPTRAPGFRRAAQIFFLARHVFDLNADSVRTLRNQGYSASHLRFGYVDDCPLFDSSRPLPLAPETEALPAAVRDWRDDGLPLTQRPLDICCFGEATLRRARLLVALAPWLQGVESYLGLTPPGGEPWAGGPGREDLPSRLSAGIARRSKIFLHLHGDAEPTVEWQRFVWLGLWQRTLVVTEPVADCAPFVAGRDFVMASSADLARILDYHLRDSQGVAEAERIREQGFRTLREAGDFPQHLREVWQPFA